METRPHGEPPTRSASTVTPAVRAASEWAWRLGAIAIAVVLLGRLLGKFTELLIPLLLALLLAALLHPVSDRLARVLPRGVAALVSLLGTLLLVGGLFALVGQQSASGFPGLRTQAAAGIGKVQDALTGGPFHLSSTALSDALTRAQDAVSTHQSTIASGALSVATTASQVLAGFFITMFSTFFFLSSGQRIWAWALRILPAAARGPLDDAARSGWVTLSHYVRATLIVAVVDGVGVGVGSALLGVPLALPLGVVVFLGAFVPVVGALVTGLLAVLVALVAQGPVVAALVLGVVVLVNQLEAHVLQPFLLGRAVEVHPLAVILLIAGGATFAGIPGALFAVPVAAVANTMITSLAGSGREADPADRIVADDAPLSPDLPASTDPDRTPDMEHGSILGARTGR